jgi:hypothetical protein
MIGMGFFMLTITIDWLAGTFRSFTNEAETFIRTFASAEDVQASKPRNGYTIAQTDNNGVVLLWNSNDNSMGHHVVFSGSALRNLFECAGVSSLALLRASIDAGLRISRLDLAKDCTGEKIDGQAIYQSLKQGNRAGTARNISRIENAQGGQTIYIGSRQSERFVRCYDKAAETGDFTKLWWRLEIETKCEVARLVANALVQGTDPDRIFDSTIEKMVGRLADVSLGAFVTDGKIEWGIPKIEKMTDREKWIADQVIAAVARHYIDNPNSEAVRNLRDMLDKIDKQRKY